MNHFKVKTNDVKMRQRHIGHIITYLRPIVHFGSQICEWICACLATYVIFFSARLNRLRKTMELLYCATTLFQQCQAQDNSLYSAMRAVFPLIMSLVVCNQYATKVIVDANALLKKNKLSQLTYPKEKRKNTCGYQMMI